MVTLDTISLERNNWRAKAYLGVLNATEFRFLTFEEIYLHDQELSYYRKLQYDKRRYNYLAGRYIAKKVLGQHLNTTALHEILITPGVFNQPIVTASTFDPPAVSISHTENVAACIVFPREHPMGLDAETIRSFKVEAIKSQLTAHEKNICLSQSDALTYIYLWTAKEALAKLLTTGLMAPMGIYQIETLDIHDEFAVSTFTNFEQYQAISFCRNDTVFSLVLPKNTQYFFT